MNARAARCSGEMFAVICNLQKRTKRKKAKGMEKEKRAERNAEMPFRRHARADM